MFLQADRLHIDGNLYAGILETFQKYLTWTKLFVYPKQRRVINIYKNSWLPLNKISKVNKAVLAKTNYNTISSLMCRVIVIIVGNKSSKLKIGKNYCLFDGQARQKERNKKGSENPCDLSSTDVARV